MTAPANGGGSSGGNKSLLVRAGPVLAIAALIVLVAWMILSRRKPAPCADHDSCQAACGRAEIDNCQRLATMLRDGKQGARRDKAAAYGVYQRTCDAGIAEGCSQAGVIVFFGGVAGVEVDRALGLEYFERACVMNDADGCTYLAKRYQLGDGVDVDVPRADRYFDKACFQLRHSPACLAAARMFSGHDEHRAQVYWGGACKAGVVAACPRGDALP